MKKIFVITGEASGDLHASNFIQRFYANHSDLDVNAMGGEQLSKVGAKLLFHYSEIAIMGFAEAISKAKYLRSKINEVVDSILANKPDVLLLVDSSGFNLRVAKKVKKKSTIPIHYYIAPKYWAWGKWRIKKFNKYIDKLYCIFPFEVQFFKSNGFNNVEYVGNPTLQEINGYKFRNVQIGLPKGKPVVALLPGSRKQEIKKHMDVMLELVKSDLSTNYVVAQAPEAPISWYGEPLSMPSNLFFVKNKTWELLRLAQKALVCSGTATLEATLIGCPQVVMYKTGRLNYILGRMLINIKYVSLVNIILNKLAVEELIQNNASVQKIAKLLKCIDVESTKILKQELISELKQ